MKERAESLKLIAAVKTPLAHGSFFEGPAPLAPRKVAAKPAAGGETGGRGIVKTDTPRTESSSTKCTRQRPTYMRMNAMYQCVNLSTKNNKSYHGEKGCVHVH